MNNSEVNMNISFSIHPKWKSVIEKKWPDWKQPSEAPGLDLQFAFVDDKLQDEMHNLYVSSGNDEDFFIIEVPSIRELFRGNRNPGSLGNTSDVKYMYIITYVERQWIALVNEEFLDVPRDMTMKEIYSQLRRRPDGSSHNTDTIYSVIWQCLAFLTGVMEISEAEYTAILSRLVRSASTFCTSVATKNMYEQLLNVY